MRSVAAQLRAARYVLQLRDRVRDGPAGATKGTVTMRRSLVSIGAVRVIAAGAHRAGGGADQDYAVDGAQHHPLGPVRRRCRSRRRRHPGEDVRRPDAAVRRRHQRRPDHLLQVGALRRRHRDPEHDRGRAAGRRHDRARLLQRPARHRRDPRRRRLGRRLDRRRGPRPAARSRRATTRRVAAIDAPGLNALEPDQRPAELPAQRPDRGRGRQADRRARGRRARGPGGPARHRRLHHRDQRLPAPRSGSSIAPWTRNDVFALNALKGQFVGQGGGDEARRSQFLAGLQQRLGEKKGAQRLQRPAPVQEPRAADLGRRPLPLRLDPEERRRAA